MPVFDGLPTKLLKFVVNFKDLVQDLQSLTNLQRGQCSTSEMIKPQKPMIYQVYIQKISRMK